MARKRYEPTKEQIERRVKGLEVVEYHLRAAEKHTHVAHDMAKELRLATKIMYVSHPSVWYRRGLASYIRQAVFHAQHEKRLLTDEDI